ncbi:MAG TPA: RNA polymerase sigma factor [Castellaniella sp.]|uniref:RNA polymerase sigma factor n=1 Tax=Castellaniella sp. TaxID=1955812 RepID=UPI002EE73B2A
MPDTLRHLDELVQRCAQGQEAALAELYRQCAPHLYALANRMLRRSDLADEVLQESFLSIWRNADRFSAEQSQAMTWMARIVRNRCIDLMRRPDYERPDPDGATQDAWADQAPGPLERLRSRQEGRRLADCLGRLEPRQRMAIVLSFFDDLSHAEIARQMSSPLGTVKSWVRRGMERLKGCLS